MTRKLVSSFLGAAFVLMLSQGALARRPPALAAQQDATARALAACPEDTTSGYRDMLARFELQPLSTGYAQTVSVVPHRRAADEVVIRCAGEVIHAGNGYRDILLRFEPESSTPVVALRR